jgi:hypothetical protein
MNEVRDKFAEMIIRYAFTVRKPLGCGFLEKVYENALAIELITSGLNNYLKATGIHRGLILNLGIPKQGFKRMVF